MYITGIRRPDFSPAFVFFAEFQTFVLLNGADELVGKGFARDIHDGCGRIVLLDMMSDCMHEVCFSKTHAAVDEKRVVRVARLFGNRDAGCVREAV